MDGKGMVPRDSSRPRDGCAGKNDGISSCCRTFQGDRTRLRAREEPGALSAGRAWRMAAQRHELAEAQERGPNRPSGLDGGRAALPADSGQDDCSHNF